ncbi:hypothetical protein GSI_11524 [Ganoderma sinense ZZ0214-1]|uniref:F-box domain-containing protein n=1 Tax=Ganoderma sinense ZZ0214-1 TaxID=1077348 RepID=A0A2G8RWB8_9APHY|nr:hypothetical protein GSI_11524 [Ganoderma sinense ZZ0214-1]
MPRLKAAFATCFSSTPGLERLSLETRFFILDLDSLPQSHPGLRSLRVFERITPHHLTFLASLPVLESLHISLSEPVKTPIRFEKLLSLSIAHDLDTAATLITSMDAPCLRNLSLNSFHPDSLSLRAELSQCLHPLVARFPSLTGFHWRCSQESDRSYGYYGSRNPNGTLAELLEPLFSLRPLRDVSLRLSGPIVPYSSTDFKRMAEAWPALETLALDLDHPDSVDLDPRYRRLVPHWTGSAPPVQQADLGAFVAFARHCPRLHTVRIPRVWMESITNVPRLLALPSESESESESGCTRMALTRHGLRLLNVHKILCPEAPQGLGSVRFNNLKNEAFRQVMGPVFPFARFQLPIVV